MTTEVIRPDLKVLLPRLRFSRMLDTLAERPGLDNRKCGTMIGCY